MTEHNTVAIVRSPAARSFFDPIAEGLAGAGCEVTEFETLDALIAEPEAASRCAVLVTPGALVVDARVLDALPRLRGLVSPFIGIEGFDVGAATRRGVLVANGSTWQNVESMAEATVLLMLAALYDLDDARDQLAAGWRRPGGMRSRMLKGRTVGVIGYGRIGQAVAARIAPWEVSLLVSTPRLKVPLPAGAEHVDLEALLSRSDIVLVLASLNAETRGLLGQAELDRMKQDAVLVVTSRGGIVDEAALAAMLRRRPEVRAALDVFATEPLAEDSPLRDLPSAILTPHGIGHTRESIASLAPAAIAAVLDLVAGRPPEIVCNPDVLDTWPAG
ncbi:NAD(P)-dependent oxidoreductase [Celeribacter indicus]|uniref:D-3-phosphoglycerate dehydrogenase,NAD-binding protein n=1 Tax=Celeribacter indicus TaxID=1208324 RepID=A0A0B5E3X2_9RHOB|nr:NAD(P)-dependent oxidoreductase [Celeribacter indicus]AJE47082.1 D-3-phosphoglycerate dehydrogenase,NAD- binding protein [Celeribacter indicus]SDW91393.1 D-3-phosphoglycerate dehydrogenase [Celeribacter indicus]